MNQKFNPRCRPGPQARFLTSPIAALSEVLASALLSLFVSEGLSALIPLIKRILITFLMGQGSCCLGETPRYRNNSWWCWSGLPQNSWRFVGGTVSCLSACASKLGRAWFLISCSAWMGWGWPRCRGHHVAQSHPKTRKLFAKPPKRLRTFRVDLNLKSD